MNNIEIFKDSLQNIMAFVIKRNHQSEGINFLSDEKDYLQVATMSHKSGHIILPHYHNKIPRQVDMTCEALIIKKGTLKVNLYENKSIVHSFTVSSGDILILLSGGHGFEVIDDVDMVEIKQGPFMGLADKTRF